MKTALIVYCGALEGFEQTQKAYTPVLEQLDVRGRWLVEEALSLCDIRSLRESVDVVIITSGMAPVSLYAEKESANNHASDMRAQRLIDFTKRVLQEELPLWGIARGHVAIAAAFEGVVEDHSERSEAGAIEVHKLAPAEGDALFGDVPETFDAVAYRVDDIMHLPVQIVPMANSKMAQFQVIKVAGKSVYGTAFDPLLGMCSDDLSVESQQRHAAFLGGWLGA